MKIFDRKRINDVVMAILICMNPICWILPVSSGAIVVISIFSLALYLLGKNNLFRPNIIGFICFNLLFFMPLCFGATDEHIHKYFLEFLAVGFVSLYVSQSPIEKVAVFNIACAISVLLCPAVVLMNIEYADPGALMGYSYGYLKMMIPILYVILFVKLKVTYKCALSIPFFLYFLKFIAFASRGTILALLVFISLIIYIKYVKNYKEGIVILIILVGVIIAFFEPIILFIQEFLANFGIDVYAFDKILRMLDNGDVTNGRSDIADVAMSMGMESPIYGHGVAAFEARYHTGYVHNIFLQLFVEGGIFLLLPYCYYIYKAVTFIVNPKNVMEERIFLSALLVMGFIELLFSSYLWRSQSFWLFIGYTMNLCRKSQNKKINHVNYYG